jgi:hypothetical protein
MSTQPHQAQAERQQYHDAVHDYLALAFDITVAARKMIVA